MAVLANFSLLGLLALGALAWGFARVLDAPKGAIRAIPMVMVLVALLSQVALPETAPFRQSVGGALRLMVYAAILAVPVLGYRTVLRRLRARSGAMPVKRDTPVGFVLIEDDTRLAADTAGALAAQHKGAVPWAPETFSVAHRDASGQITGTVRGLLNMGLLDIDGLHVAPQADSALAAGLLAELEAEGTRRGARRAVLSLHDWQAPALAAAAGYREHARVAYPDGPARITLTKDLA
ncbi:hypothetical protein [Oceanibium sediminis]|uniref:hypothetical protein n=1 Tax=Oceanibium sediminis TaxID=2026339 RepID=UPI000DD4B42C|nr:hypothetical protein [Oceanibium sediminis]